MHISQEILKFMRKKMKNYNRYGQCFHRYQRPLRNNNDFFWIGRLTFVRLSVYINAYISQVPGDFLGGLQNSFLLTQVPTFTCQYVNDTPQHRHTSIWYLRQDHMKMHPYMPAVKWLGRHTKANANSRLWFWNMTGNKTFRKASD